MHEQTRAEDRARWEYRSFNATDFSMTTLAKLREATPTSGTGDAPDPVQKEVARLLVDELNKMGAQGWELVSTYGGFWMLKRRR